MRSYLNVAKTLGQVVDPSVIVALTGSSFKVMFLKSINRKG
jgi:hypothetical protein